MNDDRFFEYCYGEYCFEREQSEKLFQRAPVALTGNALLIAGAVYILSADYFQMLFQRIDVFIYYLAATAATVLILASVFCLGVSLLSRRYRRDALPSEWIVRRKQYEADIRKAEAEKNSKGKRKTGIKQTQEWIDESVKLKVEEYSRDAIQGHIVDALAYNRDANKKRYRWFNRGVRLAFVSMIPLALEGLLFVILTLQEFP